MRAHTSNLHGNVCILNKIYRKINSLSQQQQQTAASCTKDTKPMQTNKQKMRIMRIYFILFFCEPKKKLIRENNSIQHCCCVTSLSSFFSCLNFVPLNREQCIIGAWFCNFHCISLMNIWFGSHFLCFGRWAAVYVSTLLVA